jgi:hypothetical protein
VQLTRDATPGDTLRNDGNDIGVLLEAIHNGNGFEALAVLNDDITSTLAEHAALQLDDEVSLHMQHRWEN